VRGIVDNAAEVAKRLGLSLLLMGLLLLGAGSAGAGRSGSGAIASARAFAISVIVPGQSGGSAGSVSAPPDHAAFGSGFAYPADGSGVTTGSLAASASTDVGSTAAANASGEVQSLSLFGGEVTASSVKGDATGSTRGRTASGGLSGSSVSGLTVLGQAAAVAPNGRVALADWGYAITLAESSATTTGAGGVQGFHASVTALDIHLTAAHGTLPAGSEIQVGYAEATVQAASAPPPHNPPPPPPPKRKKQPSTKPHAPAPSTGGKNAVPVAPLLPVPTGLHPTLTAGGYVFPVYGPSSYTDTFGAPRADVSYHHGDDIFAPLGAPVLACADGLVFSVGWNDIGGNRLWLKDTQGNEFYYAHLSAFSPLAANGRSVKAGDVLGFVGNTGDAEGTPTHLHFEVHPVSLLFMGYDGAVDPTPYLDAWRRLQDVRFVNVAGWVPPAGVSDPAPKPAAILLQVSDISEASGLDPGSLQRAIAARTPTEGNRALLRPLGFQPPPNAGADGG
jgi:murein DD-endopeptidase MepM/ murein hydrolase activator NlpD